MTAPGRLARESSKLRISVDWVPTQAGLEAEAERHFEPITKRVVSQLPVESRFELEIPAGAMRGLNDRLARPIQDALVSWILATAPGLPIALPGRRIFSNKR